MRLFHVWIGAAFVVVAACGNPESTTSTTKTTYDPASDSLRFSGEIHLRNIRQLTFGGNNAEAYFSYDDSELIFQSEWDAINSQGCDQQFRMRADGMPLEHGSHYQLVSTGSGRTTCGYFLPDGRIVYASTHSSDTACPEHKPFAQGRYVWPIFDSYDIYVSQPDGSNPELLIGGDGYDAEATVSPDGKYVVFTSTRSGDIELWRYEIETGALLQLTDVLGYDGGAFFSADSKRIVWRASRPEGDDAETYKGLVQRDLVEPKALNLFIADADGANARQVTELEGANWAPFFHPSGDRIIFASNHHTLAEGGREFDLFMVSIDGAELERVTHSGTFDAFAMFSFSGDKLVFASNRNKDREPSRDTNVFIADWVETPEESDFSF
jgi:TolB protein